MRLRRLARSGLAALCAVLLVAPGCARFDDAQSQPFTTQPQRQPRPDLLTLRRRRQQHRTQPIPQPSRDLLQRLLAEMQSPWMLPTVMASARKLWGPDSLEPDYAVVQNSRARQDLRDEVFRRNVRGLLREIGKACCRVGVHIRGQHVTIGPQCIRPLSEGRRLRGSPRRRIRKDHGAIQHENIVGAIHVGAVSLTRALPIAEMDAPSLLDRGPLARAVKFRREFARWRGHVGRVAKLARHFHAAGADQFLQLVLPIET